MASEKTAVANGIKNPDAAIMPLFRLAFRPFFLLGAIFSLVSVVIWAAVFSGTIRFQPFGGSYWWHTHEMLFGFVAAIVVGFLLTAVQTWTGVKSVQGRPLMALVGLWLLARLFMVWPGNIPTALIVAADLLFLPLAAFFLARPVVRVKMWRNVIFVPILLAMAGVNAVLHYAAVSGRGQLITEFVQLMVLLVALVMCVIGGRVIPMFTASGTMTPKVEPQPWLEKLSILSLLGALVLNLSSTALAASLLSGVLIVAGVANFLRALRWRIWVTFNTPLVWTLHVSYWALAVGLIMLGLAEIGVWFTSSMAIHAITVGGMGLMILSMMSRVSLGHTGRKITVGPVMNIAFILMVVAFLTRVIAPFLVQHYIHLIWATAILWAVAYGCFVLIYTPILTRPRVDGRPG